MLLGAIFAGFTFAANSAASDWLCSTVESEFYGRDPFEEESFDLLIALGGSVNFLGNGEAQTGTAGDRAVLAARLYLRGKAKHLVATGFGLMPDGQLDPMGGARAAARIWQDLGVPEDAISLVPGANTSEETHAIKQIIEERGARRVGLLTSAWHLKRAVRLARKQGLDVVPIPSDFRSYAPQPESTLQTLPIRLVPNANSLWTTSLVLKEYLAAIVGR